MRLRRPALAAVITSAALLLSGCIGIESTSSSQPQVLGSVRLSTVACVAGFSEDEPTTCEATPNNPNQPSGGANQVLYAVRLPVGFTAPTSFSAAGTIGDEAGTVTMTRNASYEQQLQTFAPAGAGRQWWGYLSAPVEYESGADARVDLALDVAVGRTTDGSPLASPLAWRSVVGGRAVTDTLPADRPVDCVPAADPEGTVYTANAEEEAEQPPNFPFPIAFPTIVCIDGPDQETVESGATDQAPFVALALSGSPATGAPASTATLSFTARRSGSTAQSAALSITGLPNGATATTTPAALPLSGAASQTVSVAVALAAGVKSGSYPVTLTATAPGGRTETATAVLTVSSDAVAPVLSKVKVKQKKGTRKVAFKVSEAATVVVKVRTVTGKGKGKVVKKVTRKVGPGTSKVRLPKLADGRYKLQVRAKDASGNKSKVRTSVFTVR